MKRILSLVLAIIMMAAIVPVNAFAENVFNYELEHTRTVYYANGKAFPNSSFAADGSNPYCNCDGLSVGSGDHWCCWEYARQAYRYIWDESFSRYNTEDNMLRNVAASERRKTAANLQNFFAAAVPGAILRIDSDPVPTNGDNNGHSMIFLGNNSSGDGGYFLEGNYDGHGRSRIYDWKWTSLANDHYTSYTYIKYIMWPDAPEFTSNRPEKPIVNVNSCQVGESVTITWQECANTTHYSMFLYELQNNEWTQIEVAHYVQSGIVRTLDEGAYRVEITATNSNYYEPDGSNWLYTNSDYAYFTVYPEHVCDQGEYMFYQALHPHCNCYRCSICGQIWVDENSSNYVESCLECHRPEKPAVINLADSYYDSETILFCWTSGANTTHCNFWLYVNNNGAWEVYERINYAESGIERVLPVGEYRVEIVATNSGYYEEDGSTWLWNQSDYAYTSVIPAVETFTVTFKDWDGTIIDTQTVESGSAATAPADPVRDGYTFTGWDVDFSNVTSDLIVTAQYEQIETPAPETPTPEPTPTPDPDAPKIVIGSKTVVVGSTVSIDVSLVNNPGIVSMLLTVHYDSRLTLQSVTNTDAIPGWIGAPTMNNPYVLGWSNDTATSNYTVNGVIATLTFEVPEDMPVGHYPITITYDNEEYEIYNCDVETVDFAVVNGTLNVIDVLIGDVNSDGKVNSLDKLYLTRYLAKWTDYPASVINMTAADVNLDTKVNSLDKLILTRYLARWEGYETLPYASKSVPSKSERGFVPLDGEPTIAVSSVQGDPGDEVTVSVSLENNPGIVSMLLTVDFDEALELVGVNDTGLLPGQVHSPTYGNPYTLMWSNDTALENYEVNGTIVELTFRIADDAEPGEYPIEISYDLDNYDIYNYEVETVYFAVDNGGVTVPAQSAGLIGDVDCNGSITAIDALMALRLALGGTVNGITPQGLINADTDADGNVNAIDALTILRLALAQ